MPTYAESIAIRNGFLRSLQRMEDAATTPLLRAYAQAMERVIADIERTLKTDTPLAGAMREAFAGTPDSYRMMILQGRAEYIYEQFERFGAQAASTTSGLANAAYAVGVTTVSKDVSALGVQFFRPNRRTVEQTMAMLQPGTAQNEYFAQFARTGTQDAIDTMIGDVIMGEGPEQIVSNLAGKMNMGRSRLRTFVRTEVLRAARAGQYDARQENADVIEGWVWQCAEGPNTCAVCWAMNGTFHEIDEELDSHPNCACVALNVTKPISEINAEYGVDGDEGDDTRIRPWDPDERFDARLDEVEKIRVLGPTKYQAWRDGDIRLADLVAPTDNPVWGRGLREVTIRELRAAGRLPLPGGIDATARAVAKTPARRIDDLADEFAAMSMDDRERLMEFMRASGMKEDLYPDEADSLYHYAEDGHVSINMNLRNGRTSIDDAPHIEALDRLMYDVTPIDRPIVTYRGINADTPELGDLFRSLEPGDEFIDAGYVSTSMERSTAEGFSSNDLPEHLMGKGGSFMLEILSPAGTRGLVPSAFFDENGLGHFLSQETEWLLPRGTTFRVLSNQNGVIRVVVQQ